MDSMCGSCTSLNPLKSGRPSGAKDPRQAYGAMQESQSPQIGASFRRSSPQSRAWMPTISLNPLKSGRPSGGKSALNRRGLLLVSIPSNRGVLPESYRFGILSLSSSVCLNPLKSGRPSGGNENEKNRGDSRKSQSPQIGASFRSRRKKTWRKLLTRLNPLKSGRPSGESLMGSSLIRV